MNIKQIKLEAKSALKGNIWNILIANLLMALALMGIFLVVFFLAALFPSLYIAGRELNGQTTSLAFNIFINFIYFIITFILTYTVITGITLGFYNFLLNIRKGYIARAGSIFKYLGNSKLKKTAFKEHFKYSIIPSIIGFLLLMNLSGTLMPVELSNTFSPFEIMFSLMPTDTITNAFSVIFPALISAIILFVGVYLHLPFFIALRKKDIQDKEMSLSVKEIGKKYKSDFIKLSFSFILWILAIYTPELLLKFPSVVSSMENMGILSAVEFLDYVMLFVNVYFYCYINMAYVIFYDKILTDSFGEDYTPDFGESREILYTQTQQEVIDRYRNNSYNKGLDTSTTAPVEEQNKTDIQSNDSSADEYRKKEAKRQADAEMGISIRDTRRKI